MLNLIIRIVRRMLRSLSLARSMRLLLIRQIVRKKRNYIYNE
nr:hypothetical protein Q903MT_gene6051 [Picea sitchensis]